MVFPPQPHAKSPLCLDWSVESTISPAVWHVIPSLAFARSWSIRERNILFSVVWRLEHSQVRKFKIWTCTSFIGFEELRLFQCLKCTHFTIHACCNVQDSNHEHHHITWFSLVFTFLDTVGGWFRVRNWLSFVCNTSKRNISISIPTSFELTPRSLFHFSLNVWRGYHWRTLS